MPRRFTITITIAAVVAGTLLTLSSFAQPGANETTQPAQPAELPSTDAISYALGYRIGMSLKQDGIDVDAKQFTEGMVAGLDDEKEPRIAEAEMQQTLMTYQQHLQQKQLDQQQAAAQKNQAEGEAFLEANAQKPGVEQTESGLQYQVIETGAGASPGPRDRVVVHYTGTLLNGETFDSSRERGEPLEFALNGVIRGWTEGLQLMKEGARYKLFVPADLAYGERGQGGAIPPSATLIFDVELLEVKPAQTENADAGSGGAD